MGGRGGVCVPVWTHLCEGRAWLTWNVLQNNSMVNILMDEAMNLINLYFQQ